MTNHYFKLKKGNYFQLYERILGLTKIEEHNGSFTQKGDSLVLRFCSDTIPVGLMCKAYIDNENRKIVLLATDTTYNEHFQFRKDKRRQKREGASTAD